MNLVWQQRAWEDYVHWQATDTRMLRKINALLRECQRHPFEGAGKPGPLKGNLAGFWSRRIDREHRLVYAVERDAMLVAQCRFHY